MSRVVIVLSSFNRPNMVKQAVESVINQTHKDWALYIMDDNSISQVQDILREYSRTDNRIKLFISDVKEEDRIKTCRYSVLINKVIRESSEEYITYLTDDCIYKPNRLERMVKYLDTHPEAEIVYGSQEVVGLSGELLQTRVADKVLNRASYIVDHNSVMHRRGLIDKIGYWDEDVFYWRIADATYWDRITDEDILFYPLGTEITEVNVLHPKSISECIMRNKDFHKGLRE